jgi:hypothetical protein
MFYSGICTQAYNRSDVADIDGLARLFNGIADVNCVIGNPLWIFDFKRVNFSSLFKVIEGIKV